MPLILYALEIYPHTGVKVLKELIAAIEDVYREYMSRNEELEGEIAFYLVKILEKVDDDKELFRDVLEDAYKILENYGMRAVENAIKSCLHEGEF